MLGARTDSPDGAKDLVRPPVFVLRIRIATIPKHEPSIKYCRRKASWTDKKEDLRTTKMSDKLMKL